MKPCEITAVPILSDNYAWVITTGDGSAAVIDPGQAEPVQAHLEAHGLELGAILITHRHGDHVGGVAQLVQRAHSPVWAPAAEPVPEATHRVREGDAIHLGELELEVWELPGHTAGHIGYVAPGLVLTGDTLFTGGCGRLFGGTPAQLKASLDRLAALDSGTTVYCAHEYTLANLGFARQVEPDNPALASRLKQTQELRATGQPTASASIQTELQTNPFLRTDQEGVVTAVTRHCGHALGSEVEVFTELRRWKDQWRG